MGTDEVKVMPTHIPSGEKLLIRCFRALSAEQKLIYFAAVTALKKTVFGPSQLRKLRGWDFHRRVQGDDILYFNVRSLLPKLDDLRIILLITLP